MEQCKIRICLDIELVHNVQPCQKLDFFSCWLMKYHCFKMKVCNVKKKNTNISFFLSFVDWKSTRFGVGKLATLCLVVVECWHLFFCLQLSETYRIFYQQLFFFFVTLCLFLCLCSFCRFLPYHFSTVCFFCNTVFLVIW